MNNITDLPGKEMCRKDKCQERRISFKKIVELILDNRLKKPKFKIDLDDDKIDEMIKSYKKNPEYLLFKDKIVIAMTIVQYSMYDIYYNMYVVDGQHRLEMARRLYEEDKINDYMTFCFFHVKTDKEMKKLFMEINKDSYKNTHYISLDDFKQNIYDMMREYLIINKSSYFADKKKETNKRYTISEFLNKLQNMKVFEKYNNFDELVKDLEDKNKTFCNMIEYLEYFNDMPCPFYKDEEECIRNNIIYSLKNNNFINFFVDSIDTVPDHKFKITKKYISPKIRMCVWNRYFGKNETGSCPLCNNMIRVGKNGFHCGHIKSTMNGGLTEIDNLRPICGDCNINMGGMNWDDYLKKLSTY